MTVEIVNGVLVIKIPVQDPPRPSASGKTLIVATSGGNQATSAIVNGKPVIVGLYAYIGRYLALPHPDSCMRTSK